jgi:hypothetical protein
MAYIPVVWTNEVPNGLPLRYKITDFDGTVLAEGAMIELLNAVVPGTPVNAANLNHLEQGVKTAQDTADSGVSKANAAQGAANLAQTAANTAQATANTAKTSAAAAQTSANSAAASASAAQSTANTANTGATNALAAAASAQSTANTANANANTAIGDAAAAMTEALARAAIFGYAERTTEFSTASEAFVDVTSLSVTVNMPAAGTIMVWASGSIRAASLYGAANVRAVIDGTASPVTAKKSNNSATTDISWVPFNIIYRKAVTAGAKVVKLQMQQSGGPGNGTVYMETGNIMVLAFQD